MLHRLLLALMLSTFIAVPVYAQDDEMPVVSTAAAVLDVTDLPPGFTRISDESRQTESTSSHEATFLSGGEQGLVIVSSVVDSYLVDGPDSSALDAAVADVFARDGFTNGQVINGVAIGNESRWVTGAVPGANVMGVVFLKGTALGRVLVTSQNASFPSQDDVARLAQALAQRI